MQPYLDLFIILPTACYFSSLMQVLFFLPNIQEKILNFDIKKSDVIKEYLAQNDGKMRIDMSNIDNIDRLDENERTRL